MTVDLKKELTFLNSTCKLDKFFSDSECKELIDFYDQTPVEELSSTYSPEKNRRQSVAYIKSTHLLYNKLQDKIRKICPQVLNTLDIVPDNLYRHSLDIDKDAIIPLPDEVEQCKYRVYELFISKYSVGDYCGPHPDNFYIGRMYREWFFLDKGYDHSDIHKNPRLFLISGLLNNPQDFTGGTLNVYKYINDKSAEEITQQKGDVVCMYPSIEHEVTPIESGERYAFISWAYLDHEDFYPENAEWDVVK